jgi:hypothetical protein
MVLKFNRNDYDMFDCVVEAAKRLGKVAVPVFRVSESQFWNSIDVKAPHVQHFMPHPTIGEIAIGWREEAVAVRFDIDLKIAMAARSCTVQPGIWDDLDVDA